MYQRFTDRARKVLSLANQEAIKLNHEYVGTEHILLGLAKEGNGVAAHVLKNLGMSLENIRTKVNALIQSEPTTMRCQLGKLPLTPTATKVVMDSTTEADMLGHNYVGTEHLLLALIKEQEGIAAKVLLGVDLTSAKIREEILNLLGHGPKVETEIDAHFIKEWLTKMSDKDLAALGLARLPGLGNWTQTIE